jgi:VIT1/CCC1 family predicted Fe2+/Mn2+ transporter
MDKKTMELLLRIQKNEITEYHMYLRLSKITKDEKNKKVLSQIADAEKAHGDYWEKITKIKVKPNIFKVYLWLFSAKIFGITFVLKFMEKREGTGSKLYDGISESFIEAKKISHEESMHEKALIEMLDEEKLRFVGSIVLGLNDALVELTGALAGFTLALGQTKTISLAGLITGISAAFSMAASDYLSSKAEGDPKAAKSALYTGVAYIITVILLILPFLLIKEKFICLGITLFIVILIIFFFNYYLSIAKDLNFKHRFFEMAFISLGVATFSFFIGWFLKIMLNVDV